MNPSATSTPTALAVILRYAACLRVADILVLQGPPLLGLFLANPRAAAHDLAGLATLVVANVLLMAHVFLINDWSGLSTDLADPNKASNVFTTRGVRPAGLAGFALALLALSLLLFGRIGAVTLVIAIAIAVLSALYSLPPWNWKGRPLVNSGAHLVGGTLHFLLGYSFGATVDGRGLTIGAFFALVFAAGHLVTEIRDYAGDEANGIRTNAVAFGTVATFRASLALFTLAQVTLLALAINGVLPRPVAYLVVLYALQLYWSFKARREKFTFASICRLQNRYRALYAILGIAIVAGVWSAG